MAAKFGGVAGLSMSIQGVSCVPMIWKVFLAVLLLSTGVACGPKPPEYVSRYTPPPNLGPALAVAVIGDSSVGGSDMGGHQAKGWPSLVATRLRQDGIPASLVLGTERGSGFAVKGPKYGSVFADQVPRVVGPRTRLVILFGSRLDAEAAAPEIVDVAVRQTFSAVKLAAPAARMLVIAPISVTATPTMGLLQVRDILRNQSAAVGAAFVDPVADGWFADRPDLIGTDRINPTDAGHKYMSEKIEPFVAQELGR